MYLFHPLPLLPVAASACSICSGLTSSSKCCRPSAKKPAIIGVAKDVPSASSTRPVDTSRVRTVPRAVVSSPLPQFVYSVRVPLGIVAPMPQIPLQRASASSGFSVVSLPIAATTMTPSANALAMAHRRSMESSSKLLEIVMMSAPSLIACSMRRGVSFTASPVQPDRVQFDASP